MTAGADGPARQREQHKRNLLLASQLARGQAVGAVDELGARADALADHAVQWRQWLSSPLLWVAASAAGTFGLRVLLRRGRKLRLLRWGWLVWRVWRSAAPALARYRALR